MSIETLPSDATLAPSVPIVAPSHDQILNNVRCVSLLTILSRILGMIRDIGMAVLFGGGIVLDAFTLAFRIPNTARSIFGEGALTTAFLPRFMALRDRLGASQADQFALQFFWKLASRLIYGVIVLEIILITILCQLSPNSSARLLLTLTAIMLPYLPCICLAAQLHALLHSRNIFHWPALSPIIFNTIWLATLCISAFYFHGDVTRITIISCGLVVGGLVQLWIPWRVLQLHENTSQLSTQNHQGEIRALFRNMLPIVFGLSITQLNTMSDGMIAWWISNVDYWSQMNATQGWDINHGTATALYLGQRLYQFPLGVFGVALGTVLFPSMSLHADRGDFASFRKDLEFGLRLIAVIGLPASIGLMLISFPLTSFLFQHGHFNAQDTIQTSDMVYAYATGIWAYILLLVLHRAFYALNDRSTPLRVGIGIVLLNLMLNFIFLPIFGAAGLAYSTAFTAMVQTLIVGYLLKSKIGSWDFNALYYTTARTLFATGVMAATILGSDALITMLLANEPIRLPQKALLLFVPMISGIAVYIGMCHLLKIRELFDLIYKRRRLSSESSSAP